VPPPGLSARTISRCESEIEARSTRGRPFAATIRSLSFCACYIYSPRGEALISEGSRLLRARLKAGDPEWLPKYAGHVCEQVIRQRQFPGLFGVDVILVPVPGSTPSATGSWAAERLAIALKGVGLARTVWAGLHRRFPVRKSATALTGERPTVQQHYDSFSVARSPTTPERIVLVDDVITKGRTLLAAAARLHDAFPNADIRAFALVRTMGFLSDVNRLLEPCQGIVRWAGGDARREP
jgi:adenine/guanine phosphoribosyltransferase-like PRPP-binding protein